TDGDLPGLDAVVVPDHRHRLPGHLGPGRNHAGGVAGRGADRRAARRRPFPAGGRCGLRGDVLRELSGSTRLRAPVAARTTGTLDGGTCCYLILNSALIAEPSSAVIVVL